MQQSPGSVGPATLVTRWFTRNRGLALGVVHLPVVIAVLPVALNAYLKSHGAQASYLALGTFAAIALVPLTLLARDYPPGYRKSAATASGARTADGSFTVPQLLAAPRFWALCIAAIASMTSSVVLSALLVPMGVSWGFSRGQAALLASGMSAVGLLGSILFGWIADRLGGARALALIGLDCAILWALLALHWPFPIVAVIVGLIGMHGAGAIPTLSRGLSDVFGQASFSRAFGLNTIIGLPFIALGVIGAASVQAATGSYVPAQLAIAGFFVVAIGLALYAASGRKTPAEAPPLA